MKPTEDEIIEMARTAFATAARHVTQPDSNLQAILIATDGDGLFITPLRLTKHDAFCLLVAACSALEPEENKPTDKGEMH